MGVPVTYKTMGRENLMPKVMKEYFLDTHQSKEYEILNKTTNQVEKSMNVIFVEGQNQIPKRIVDHLEGMNPPKLLDEFQSYEDKPDQPQDTLNPTTHETEVTGWESVVEEPG